MRFIRIKGGTADETFHKQRFLWEKGASFTADFDLFNFQDFLYKKKKKKNAGRKGKKSIIILYINLHNRQSHFFTGISDTIFGPTDNR